MRRTSDSGAIETILREDSIDGHKFTITVGGDGSFNAKVLGEYVTAPSLKGLTEKVRKLVRRAGRIAVPATRIATRYNRKDREVPEIEQIHLTGLHGSNRNILYKVDKTGVTEQGSWGAEFYRRLSDKEIAHYLELVRDQDAANKAIEVWKEKHLINAHEAINAAAAKVDDIPADPQQEPA